MTIKTTIGIDISKDFLDVYSFVDNQYTRFANIKAGHKALVKWLDNYTIERIVYEATGVYHRALEAALGAADMPLCKVNPLQARRFAQSTGTRAKTDRVDAMMLARMGVALRTTIRPAPTKNMNDLKALYVARRALNKDRTAAMNREKHLELTLLKRQNKARITQIKSQMKAIDMAIEALIRKNEHLSVKLDILLSIPGIGPVAAFALLIDMPELGTLNPRQVASLAGLAPMTRQSGKWKGKAFTGGGRAKLRCALYMPALVATRFNPDMKIKYQSLIQKGKPAKVAITAIMRKLIILANTLLKQNRKWQQKGTC